MEYASELDSKEDQKSYSHLFHLPTNSDLSADLVPPERAGKTCTYLCGNSLGVLPKRSAELVQEELHVWGTRGCDAHFTHPQGRAWKYIVNHVNPLLAELLGALNSETACMGTLTANLHLLMGTYYKPTKERYKILCEARAFPSDQYAFASQATLHGLDPQDAVLELHPREGEYALRNDDILDTIRREGKSIALVLFSGVQYYTGQWFNMKEITKVAHEQGCICGWDLAHTIGNVPLRLHDWEADFAVWCSYKYLNSGPGGIGGIFIHEKWHQKEPPRMAGWWGHDPETRFDMVPDFSPIPGAQGFQLSNPSVLATVSLLGGLQAIQTAGGMQKLRAKSVRLTAYMEKLLRASKYFIELENAVARAATLKNPRFTIITPKNPEERGTQLSLVFFPSGSGAMEHVFESLKRRGVWPDERKPDVLRFAPMALYNTYEDCWRATEALNESIKEVEGC